VPFPTLGACLALTLPLLPFAIALAVMQAQ
jgi:hypothetical protein